LHSFPTRRSSDLLAGSSSIRPSLSLSTLRLFPEYKLDDSEFRLYASGFTNGTIQTDLSFNKVCRESFGKAKRLLDNCKAPTVPAGCLPSNPATINKVGRGFSSNCNLMTAMFSFP